MCSVLELERNEDRMAPDGPEARAFRMALEVLEDRNNRIGREWNIRVPCLPPIFSNLIAAHVIDLLGMVCYGECIGDISVPYLHTQKRGQSDLKTEMNMVWCGCITHTTEHCLFTASGSITDTSHFLPVVFVRLDQIEAYQE
jgi:hypothetical protein